MRRLVVIASLLLGFGFGIKAHAGIDPAVHLSCKEARDYQGCVAAQTGVKAGATTTNIQTNIDGGIQVAGNSCPEGYAYIGGGYCREVICINRIGSHNQILGGKKWSCERYRSGWLSMLLELDGPPLRATSNSSCPTGEPEIGWTNTCEKNDPGTKEAVLIRK